LSKENPDGLLALALVPVRDVLVKIAELLALILEKLDQIGERLGVPAVPPVPPAVPALPPVIITEPRCNNRYKIFEIDLTTAHTDQPLGILDLLKKHGVLYANFMVVLAAPSPFAYKVNSVGADLTDAVVGEEWEYFEITEVYVTNAAGAGKGEIHVEFRVD